MSGNKKRRNRSRISPISPAASEPLQPIQSIRLSHGSFANTIAAKYGWSVGAPSKRGAMVHRLLAESRAAQGDMSVSLHMAVHLRTLQSILRLRVPPVQLSSGQQHSTQIMMPAGNRMLRQDRTAIRSVNEVRNIVTKQQQSQQPPRSDYSQQSSSHVNRSATYTANHWFRLVNATRILERGNDEQVNTTARTAMRKESKQQDGAAKQQARQTLLVQAQLLGHYNRTLQDITIQELRSEAAASLSGSLLSFGQGVLVPADEQSRSLAVQAPLMSQLRVSRDSQQALQVSQVLRTPHVRGSREALALNEAPVRQFIQGIHRVMHVLHSSMTPVSNYAYKLHMVMQSASSPAHMLRTGLRIGNSSVNRLNTGPREVSSSAYARRTDLQQGNSSSYIMQSDSESASSITHQLRNTYLRRESHSPIYQEAPTRTIQGATLAERTAFRDFIDQKQSTGLEQAMRQAGIWLVRYMQQHQSAPSQAPILSESTARWTAELSTRLSAGNSLFASNRQPIQQTNRRLIQQWTAEENSTANATPNLSGKQRRPAMLFVRRNTSAPSSLPEGASSSKLIDKLIVERSLHTALSRIVSWQEQRVLVRNKDIERYWLNHHQQQQGSPSVAVRSRTSAPSIERLSRSLHYTVRQSALHSIMRMLEQQPAKNERHAPTTVRMTQEAPQLWQRILHTRERLMSTVLRQHRAPQPMVQQVALQIARTPIRIGQSAVDRSAVTVPARSAVDARKQARTEPQANPTVPIAQARSVTIESEPQRVREQVQTGRQLHDRLVTHMPSVQRQARKPELAARQPQARPHSHTLRVAQPLQHSRQSAGRTLAQRDTRPHSQPHPQASGMNPIAQRLAGRVLLTHTRSLTSLAEGMTSAHSVRSGHAALQHLASNRNENGDVQRHASAANRQLGADVRMIPRSATQPAADRSTAGLPRSSTESRPVQAVRMDVAPGKVKQANPEVTPAVQSLQKSVKSIEQELNQVKEHAGSAKVDMNRLVDRMYREFARRIRFEQQRRGI